MHKIIRILLPALLCLLAASCSQPAAEVDGWQRSKADRLNKLAFQRRYYNAEGSERYARQALQFINDSLPNYDNGRLRAWNNIATSFCFRAMHDSAIAYVDSVLAYNGRCSNREVEQTLAQLVKAKLLQRNCDIAGSYQILYNIENSGLLEGNEGGMLYNLARSEFYITTTTLNYHYRSKSQYQQAELLTEMEQRRDKLRCDYAEDMSFNYALAYGYYSLCSDTAMQGRYLGKALHYCAENLHLLGDSNRFNTYHLGDTYQLLGFMLWSRHMKASSWHDNAVALDSICRYVYNTFGFDIASEADTTFAFLREATSLFFLHDDPYQRLGAIVSTGRYCMVRGDTATARNYFYEALIDSTMLGIAPKFEAMLYEGFLTAGCAENLNEVAQWTRHEIELLNYIKQNERADFMLQLELSKTRRDSRLFMIFSVVLAVLSLGLVVTLVLLRRRTKALQRETTKLQQAKQQDIERIANVETCLSVLRHDITPFISYLRVGEHQQLPRRRTLHPLRVHLAVRPRRQPVARNHATQPGEQRHPIHRTRQHQRVGTPMGRRRPLRSGLHRRHRLRHVSRRAGEPVPHRQEAENGPRRRPHHRQRTQHPVRHRFRTHPLPLHHQKTRRQHPSRLPHLGRKRTRQGLHFPLPGGTRQRHSKRIKI